MTLPAFKRTPQCPKCGSDNIAFDYKSARKDDEDDFRRQGTCGWLPEMHFGEHIHLTCDRCAYGKTDPWIMAIPDSPRTVGFRGRSMSTDSTGTVLG